MKKRQLGLLAMTLVLVLVSALLAGCSGGGSSATPSTPAASTPDAPASTPDEGGDDAVSARDTLRIAFTSEPPSLSIYDHSSLISVLMNKMTYNGLMKVNNATLETECDLAESYSVENETDWTFKLKENVKFHNGEDMTADDVVASIMYAKSVPASELYTGSIASVEAVDTYTVKIITHEPYAGLLNDLAYYFNFIVPKSLIEAENDFNENPVGTGPYKFVNWDYGNSITLEGFDDFFDTDHVAKIKNIEISIIPEGASRTMALEAGEIDLVWEVSGADVAGLQSNDAVEVVEINSVDNVILFFNNDKAPFDDMNLRNAIASAINRDDIIAGALNGYGTPNISCMVQNFPGNTNENALPYDLDKAQEYLDAWGGDAASLSFDLLCSNETRVAIGTVIQANLAQLGITVNVVPVDTATYMAQWKAGDFESLIASWSPADDLSYAVRFHTDRRATYAGALNNAEIDEKVLEAKRTLDAGARTKLIQEIVAEVNAMSPQVSLYQSLWFRAHSADLAGVVCSATGYADFQDMYWTA